MKKIFMLCLLTSPVAAQISKAPQANRYELRGVVTYYFNENYGNRPDVGAKAFVIKKSALKAAGIDIKALQVYLENHDAVEFDPANPNKPQAQPLPGEEYAVGSKELEDAAYKTEQFILKSDVTSISTSDGNGVFVKRLLPGEYLVMIRSANRTRINLLESIGQVVLKQISIKDDDKEVSVNFRP